MEFCSLIPNMDKDIAKSIIAQFPDYTSTAREMLKDLKGACDTALEKNAESHKAVLEGYKIILDGLDVHLKEDISHEEKMEVADKMIDIADKIAEIDAENKAFIKDIVKNVAMFGAGSLVFAAAILGVNIKGVDLPVLKK